MIIVNPHNLISSSSQVFTHVWLLSQLLPQPAVGFQSTVHDPQTSDIEAAASGPLQTLPARVTIITITNHKFNTIKFQIAG